MRKIVFIVFCLTSVTRLQAQSNNNGMDTLKQGIRNIGNLFKKASVVTLTINGIENNDNNLVALKKNILQTINVKKIEDSYVQNTVTLKVSYKGKATDLWNTIPANAKQAFLVNSMNDSLVNLNYRYAKTTASVVQNTNLANPGDKQATSKDTIASKNIAGNNSLSKGAGLLFKNIKTKLSDNEKNAIFDSLRFIISKDGKQFISDAESADYPFDAFVYPTDFNKDDKEEIFVVFGNSYTSGMAGSSINIYIADKNGTYRMNLGFPGMLPDALATVNLGYPDLLIGGPGMEFPVYRWNGKMYDYFRTVKNADYEKLKPTSVEALSKTYSGTIKPSE